MKITKEDVRDFKAILQHATREISNFASDYKELRESYVYDQLERETNKLRKKIEAIQDLKKDPDKYITKQDVIYKLEELLQDNTATNIYNLIKELKGELYEQG